MNRFSASASVSLVTNNTTVELIIDGQKITVQLVNGSILVVDSYDKNLTVNTAMRPTPTDTDLLTSDISTLELPKRIEDQLRRRGIEYLHQIVDRNRQNLFGRDRSNPSREKWLDEIELALAKKELFLGMAFSM
jgi:DNA-directed RNA polymerase alpha subunit